MSLKALEKAILGLSAEKLEWPEFNPPLFMNISRMQWEMTLSRHMPCPGASFCFIQDHRGEFSKPKGYGCLCKLEICSTCKKSCPIWILRPCYHCIRMKNEKTLS